MEKKELEGRRRKKFWESPLSGVERDKNDPI